MFRKIFIEKILMDNVLSERPFVLSFSCSLIVSFLSFHVSLLGERSEASSL